MRRLVYFFVLTVFIGFGCAQEIDGPEPQMHDDPEELATDPSFVCNADHEEEGTWVTLDGDAFSPLVVDAISGVRDDDVELPTATLIRRLDPYGESVDESFETTLESPLGSDDGQVRWLDGETLQLRISDDLELLDGVYDITVRNPNGQTATETEALGVTDRPELHAAIPELTCVAQGERDIVLEGENLLVEGDDEQVPTVRLFNTEMEVEQQVEVIDTADCRELHSAFTGHRLCEEVTVRLEEQSFEPGVYTVSTETFDPAQCANLAEEDGVTVTIHPPPEAHEISPTPVCSEQIDYESMAVDGDEFVVVEQNGETVYPTVAIGERVYDAHTAEECEDIDTAPALNAQKCTRLLIDVHEGELSDQVAADEPYTDLHVEVTNPDPVGCHSTEDTALTATPPPMVDVAAPDPMCTAQFENTVTVDGFGFLSIGDGEPVVHIGDETYEVDSMEGCTDVPTPDEQTASCERVTVVVPAGDLALDDLEPEANDVVVENPETANCSSTDDAHVQVVHPPVVEAIEPDPICTEQETRTLRIDGAEFLEIDEELGEVTIGEETFEVTEVENCEQLQLHEDGREVHRCTTLFVDVDAGVHDPGVHEVMVTNPEPADCWSEEQLDVETVAPPTITAIQPRAFCTTDDTTLFDVYGDDLYEVDGEAPTIELDEETYETEAFNCTDVDDDTRLCERLEFEVESGEIEDDVHRMVATNPDPIGCSSEPSERIVAAGPPVLTDTEPAAVCEGEEIDEEMTLIGEFVHDPDGDDPVVTMNQVETSVTGYGDCETTDLEDFELDTCTELHTTVPEQLQDQSFDVTVAGADPVACGSSTITVERLPAPTIDEVIPQRICDAGGTLTVNGEDIHEDAEFELNGYTPTTVDIADDGTSADITFDGPISGDVLTLEITNPGDCGTIYEEEDIRVTEGPNPVYVDPPAMFDGMTMQVTIYAAGLRGGSIDQVELVHPDGTAEVVDHEIDEDRDNIVQAIIPEGRLDDDEDSVDFGIRLTDEINGDACTNSTSELLTITSELTVAIDSIDPAFGGTPDDTAVEIFAVDEDDLEDDEVQFEPTPRAYLNPSSVAGDDPIAREIRALQFIDETELNGIVSSGLPVGTYDVVVVNPDGQVGALFDAYEVTAQSPPVIDAVSPGSWETGTVMDVDVEGENFREDIDNPPTVGVFCTDPGDEDGDIREPDSIEVLTVEDDLLQLEVDTGGLQHLDACYMRVTNPDETWDEYSPITVTNPAGKFVEFNPGPDFDTPRRGLTSLSGVPTRKSRYLYVLGGDDAGADELTTYAHGEFARVNRFGVPQEWNYLPEQSDIPGGLSLANGVRIDDFLYVVGGTDGENVSDEVLRAQVLDPLDVPEIVNIDLYLEEFDDEDFSEPDGDLEPGVYYYRVSAVYTDDDPANPGGESLPSEPQPIQVPANADAVEIGWTAPDDINHDIDYYNVYRSVEPDTPIGTEGLIATVDPEDSSYLDDGSDEDDMLEDVNPLPVGSLGTWRVVSNLQTERMVAGITKAQNPDDSDEYFIYAVGGENDEGDFLDTYEFVSVRVEGPRDQIVDPTAEVGEVAGVPNLLPGPRAELTAMVADSSNASHVADVPPQLFTLGGQSDGVDGDSSVYVSSVNPDGHIDLWEEANGLPPGLPHYGHAGAIINNNLVALGGRDGEPTENGFHSVIECNTGNDCPPADVDQWEDLSDLELQHGRVWMGHHPFRGFWYLAGGLDDNSEPTTSVDFSVAGGAP